jgi:hypothetical protein
MSVVRNFWGFGILAAAFAASVCAGDPQPIPDLALGWSVLLHAERAAAIVGLGAVAGLIPWRAGQGQLPVRFGNIEYAIAEADTNSGVDARIESLELVIEALLSEAIDQQHDES